MSLKTPPRVKSTAVFSPMALSKSPDRTQDPGNGSKRLKTAISDKLLNLEVFLAADYSQVEIRMLAELSEDPLLIQQFNSGVDIHCQVGHTLTGWPVERIAKDKETRRKIKNFHFALIYGIGKNGIYDYMIAKGVKISRQQSMEYYDAYFLKYKGVKRFIRRMRQLAEQEGYVETLFGFRREIHQEDESRDTYWGNQAINSPVQGTAHNLVMLALALLHTKPKTYHLLQKPLMEIHDAMYWFVKLRDLPTAYHQCKALLEQDTVRYTKTWFGKTLKIPLIAEASAGFCLGSMVDYSGEPVAEFLDSWRKKHQEVKKVSWEDLVQAMIEGTV